MIEQLSDPAADATYYCDVCGHEAGDCICPECPVCGVSGDPKCYEMHGLRPKIVCLCGSTRFGPYFAKANLEETLAGNIVLSIGCNMRDDDLFAHMSDEERADIKQRLDWLHKRKIDLADEILVLNVGGYVGESTNSEIRYAVEHGKDLRWLNPPDRIL